MNSGSKYFISTITVPVEIRADGTVYAMTEKQTVEHKPCSYDDIFPPNSIVEENPPTPIKTEDQETKEPPRIFITKEELTHPSTTTTTTNKSHNITFKNHVQQQRKQKPHRNYTNKNHAEKLSTREVGAGLSSI
jgi:hypothetical protein